MTLKGIDISVYQKSNYKKLIDTYGKDFVICRAAFGTSVDAMCDTMYQYAKKKGKKLGFYFFPLTSSMSGKAHAQWAYKQVKGYIKEAIPILDWESYNGAYGKLSVSNTSWALEWLKEFERLSGVKPMIYMNSSCNSSYDWSKVVKNDNGLWIANYGKNNGKDAGRPAVKYWKFAAMHQYTSLGDNGKGLDCDTFYGDKAAWDAYAGVKKKTTTTTTKTTTTTTAKPATTTTTTTKTETPKAETPVKETKPTTEVKEEPKVEIEPAPAVPTPGVSVDNSDNKTNIKDETPQAGGGKQSLLSKIIGFIISIFTKKTK